MSVGCCKIKKSKINLNQKLDYFLKVISEENRLKILYLFQGRERCVCEIWQCLDLPQNLVSYHLKVLKNFDLVSTRKEGLKIFYTVNRKVVKKYLKLLNKFLNSKEK